MSFFDSIHFKCQQCGFNYHILDNTCDFTCICGNKIAIKYINIPNKKRKKPPTKQIQITGCIINDQIT